MTVKHLTGIIVGVVGVGILGGLAADQAILSKRVNSLQEQVSIKTQPTVVIPTASPSATVVPTAVVNPTRALNKYVAPTKAVAK